MTYIGNFEIDQVPNAVYKIVFIYPAQPFSIAIPTAVRKGNSMAFFFKEMPTPEDEATIINLANSDFVNPCPHITKNTGGVKFEKYQKVNGQWVQI